MAPSRPDLFAFRIEAATREVVASKRASWHYAGPEGKEAQNLLTAGYGVSTSKDNRARRSS